MTVGSTHQEEISAYVFTHLIDNLSQGDIFSTPGRHGKLRFTLVKSRQLKNDHFKPSGINSECGNSSFQPGDIPMMIRPPNIDQPLVTSCKLVFMISRIGTN